MKRVRLGRTGVEVSSIGLGTWAYGGPRVIEGRPVGWFGSDENEAKRALATALELGVDHWDTADVYGDGRAERVIGEALAEGGRDRVFLASKVGWDSGEFDHFYHPQLIRERLERSLKLLGTDYLDLYYLHHCDFGSGANRLDDAVAELHRAREAGKIRFIGLSDWKSAKILRHAERVDPDVVQCYRNVVDDRYEESGLKRWVDEEDRAAAFFSPLKHGLLLGNFEGPVTFGVGDHRSSLRAFRDFGLISRLRGCRNELSARFPDHPEPVLHGLLDTLLYGNPTSSVLVGMHRPGHVRAAVAAGEEISQADATWVTRLYRDYGHKTRASWKGLQNVG